MDTKHLPPTTELAEYVPRERFDSQTLVVWLPITASGPSQAWLSFFAGFRSWSSCQPLRILSIFQRPCSMHDIKSISSSVV
jgi:hypothetical protein